MKVEIFSWEGHYTYLIIDEASQEAAVVGAPFYDQVAFYVQRNNVSLTKLLMIRYLCWTNGNNKWLCKKFNGLQVYGCDDRIKAVTCKVKHDDTFNIGKLQVRCIVTPYEGTGYVCYYITGDQDTPAVFTGESFYVGGCDVLQNATAEEMYKTFNEILGSLPNETKVYCLHDFFTPERLKFAQHVEPENQIIRYKLKSVRRMQLKEKVPIVVPSTIGEEKLTNPFMRVHEQSLMDRTGQKDPIKVMASLIREWDRF